MISSRYFTRVSNSRRKSKLSKIKSSSHKNNSKNLKVSSGLDISTAVDRESLTEIKNYFLSISENEVSSIYEKVVKKLDTNIYKKIINLIHTDYDELYKLFSNKKFLNLKYSENNTHYYDNSKSINPILTEKMGNILHVHEIKGGGFTRKLKNILRIMTGRPTIPSDRWIENYRRTIEAERQEAERQEAERQEAERQEAERQSVSLSRSISNPTGNPRSITRNIFFLLILAASIFLSGSFMNTNTSENIQHATQLERPPLCRDFINDPKVIEYSNNPCSDQGKKLYRELSIAYHPDKNKQCNYGNEPQQILNQIKEQCRRTRKNNK